MPQDLSSALGEILPAVDRGQQLSGCDLVQLHRNKPHELDVIGIDVTTELNCEIAGLLSRTAFRLISKKTWAYSHFWTTISIDSESAAATVSLLLTSTESSVLTVLGIYYTMLYKACIHMSKINFFLYIIASLSFVHVDIPLVSKNTSCCFEPLPL